MAVNDFLPWATGVGALVEPQASYLTDPAVVVGVSPGLANPSLANKTWRQSSAVAAMIGQFIANQNINALDDGNVSELLTNYGTALGLYLASVTSSNPNAIIRQRLQAGTSLYVTPSGSDSNPGTSTQPWQTLQHAYNIVSSSYDFVGQNIIVQCSGNFTQGVLAFGQLVGATGGGNLVFNFAAGSTVQVSNQACFLAFNGTELSIQGSVLFTSVTGAGTLVGAGSAIWSGNGANVSLQSTGITFGACSVSHLTANNGAIGFGAGYSITGGATSHYLAQSGGGSISSQAGTPGVITLVGTPGFSNAFAVASLAGQLSLPSSGMSFSGAATGPRFLHASNGIINTAGGGPSFFPGNAAGIAGTPPGLYL
jgi:hypothetical protein